MLPGGDGLSSLLGGVLNGETRASKDGRLWLCSGNKPSDPLCGGGAAVMLNGFTGILGLSARLIGGGFGATAAILDSAPARGLSRVGVDGLLDVLLECCEMKSLTFEIGVPSALSGDLEAPRLKKLRGGELGDSTLTAGVNLGDPPASIEIACR